MKNHIRDYATEAFRFYARNGKSAEKYKQKIYDEALQELSKEKGSGISKPTEAAIMRAETAVNEKVAEIKDMEAVELTMAELNASKYRDYVQAIEFVYFKDADKKLQKGDIYNRVHQAEINIPASERTIYNWLSKARKIFAINRGLRI
jgi:hypothetical protein